MGLGITHYFNFSCVDTFLGLGYPPDTSFGNNSCDGVDINRFILQINKTLLLKEEVWLVLQARYLI